MNLPELKGGEILFFPTGQARIVPCVYSSTRFSLQWKVLIDGVEHWLEPDSLYTREQLQAFNISGFKEP